MCILCCPNLCCKLGDVVFYLIRDLTCCDISCCDKLCLLRLTLCCELRCIFITLELSLVFLIYIIVGFLKKVKQLTFFSSNSIE